MRVIVTGATGFLGGVLVRELHQAGHVVTGLGRNLLRGEALQANGVRFVASDLRDTASWLPLLAEQDAMVHAAAGLPSWSWLSRSEWAELYASNVAASGAIAQACGRHGLRLVHISSPSIYNSAIYNATNQLQKIPEDLPVGPHFDSPYAKSKYLAEQQVRLHYPAAVILRPRGIYGKGDTSIVPRLLLALRSERLPRLTRSEVWTELTHVQNVTYAIRLALDSHAAGTFNLTDGEALPLWATLDEMADRLQVKRPQRYISPKLLEGISGLLEVVARLRCQSAPTLTTSGVRLLSQGLSLDLTRARQELGYRPPISVQQGLAEVMACL